MIKKPSGLDLKYQNLGTEDAIREYERDTMIWEIYNNSKPKFNPLTDIKATYYPDIDDDNDYGDIDEDFDEISILRSELDRLVRQLSYYEGEALYQDNTVGIGISLLGGIGVLFSIPAGEHISTPICIVIALLIPILFKIYYSIKQHNAKNKVVVLKKQITNIKSQIKNLKKERK